MPSEPSEPFPSFSLGRWKLVALAAALPLNLAHDTAIRTSLGAGTAVPRASAANFCTRRMF